LASQWKTAKVLGSFSLTHNIIAGIKIQDVAEALFVLATRAWCALFVLYGSLPHAAVDQQQSQQPKWNHLFSSVQY